MNIWKNIWVLWEVWKGGIFVCLSIWCDFLIYVIFCLHLVLLLYKKCRTYCVTVDVTVVRLLGLLSLPARRPAGLPAAGLSRLPCVTVPRPGAPPTVLTHKSRENCNPNLPLWRSRLVLVRWDYTNNW